MMMDALSEMLMTGLSPQQQLVAAITNGMTDAVSTIIRNGGAALVNAVLQQQNGRQALHIVCQVGQHEYIRRLVAAGARPDAEDAFGMTPLDLALRSGHAQCVEMLLGLSRNANPRALWTAQTRAGIETWKTFSDDVVSLLIIATPNFSQTDAVRELKAKYFYQPAAHLQLIRTFLLTGNKLTQEESRELSTNYPQLGDLIKSLSFNVPHLVNICRLVVRRTIQTNVIYAAKQLPIPVTLQNFLVSVDV